MKKLLLLSFALFLLNGLGAQGLIAVQHEGESSFFTALQPAIDAAVSGDTVFLPGGNFGTINLNKSLAIIGVGTYPDSTIATNISVMAGLNIYNGANNSFISGIWFTSAVHSVETTSGIVISRCYLNGGIGIQNNNGVCSNWIITENWIGSHYTGYSIYNFSGNSSGFLISNNVLYNGMQGSYIVSSLFSNNVFLNGYPYASNSSIKNNVFSSNYESSTTNCQWNNNLNAGVNGVNNNQNNQGSGNYLDNVALTTALVNYSGNNTFLPNDFHVVNPAYLGDDGLPIGIYGGLYIWKAGSVPFNPHIQTKTIAPTTNAQGNLEVQVRVAAQDH